MNVIFLLLALFCQNPKHTTATHGCPFIHVSTLDDDGSDDTGHVPPKPPVPPPPPPVIP